ncbi:hypothetical protein GGF31_007852 [Allomyces arbusculus]|nr:hypothetical protein GGF31_007852 [Allomyces arbusculus]
MTDATAAVMPADPIPPASPSSRTLSLPGSTLHASPTGSPLSSSPSIYGSPRLDNPPPLHAIPEEGDYDDAAAAAFSSPDLYHHHHHHHHASVLGPTTPARAPSALLTSLADPRPASVADLARRYPHVLGACADALEPGAQRDAWIAALYAPRSEMPDAQWVPYLAAFFADSPPLLETLVQLLGWAGPDPLDEAACAVLAREAVAPEAVVEAPSPTVAWTIPELRTPSPEGSSHSRSPHNGAARSPVPPMAMVPSPLMLFPESMSDEDGEDAESDGSEYYDEEEQQVPFTLMANERGEVHVVPHDIPAQSTGASPVPGKAASPAALAAPAEPTKPAPDVPVIEPVPTAAPPQTDAHAPFNPLKLIENYAKMRLAATCPSVAAAAAAAAAASAADSDDTFADIPLSPIAVYRHRTATMDSEGLSGMRSRGRTRTRSSGAASETWGSSAAHSRHGSLYSYPPPATSVSPGSAAAALLAMAPGLAAARGGAGPTVAASVVVAGEAGAGAQGPGL